MLPAKILIVDDDPRLRSLLKYFLIEKGFEVQCVADAEQMTHNLKLSFYDLIILDWMMPGEDGLSVCNRLHAQENSPLIIMLTANGSENDAIAGLLCGADDYLAKPFNTDVLLARIGAVLRRRPRLLACLPDNTVLLFHFGSYVLDFSQRCLYKKDSRINLTSNEFARATAYKFQARKTRFSLNLSFNAASKRFFLILILDGSFFSKLRPS